MNTKIGSRDFAASSCVAGIAEVVGHRMAHEMSAVIIVRVHIAVPADLGNTLAYKLIQIRYC